MFRYRPYTKVVQEEFPLTSSSPLQPITPEHNRHWLLEKDGYGAGSVLVQNGADGLTLVFGGWMDNYIVTLYGGRPQAFKAVHGYTPSYVPVIGHPSMRPLGGKSLAYSAPSRSAPVWVWFTIQGGEIRVGFGRVPSVDPNDAVLIARDSVPAKGVTEFSIAVISDNQRTAVVKDVNLWYFPAPAAPVPAGPYDVSRVPDYSHQLERIMRGI